MLLLATDADSPQLLLPFAADDASAAVAKDEARGKFAVEGAAAAEAEMEEEEAGAAAGAAVDSLIRPRLLLLTAALCRSVCCSFLLLRFLFMSTDRWGGEGEGRLLL